MQSKISRKADTRLRLVGHPLAPIGMGEHLRSVARSLLEVGIPVGIVDVYGPQGTPDPALTASMEPFITQDLGAGTNIYVMNGDEIVPCLAHLRGRNPMAEGSRNIVFPAWELSNYCEEWATQLNRFDEVWASSAFTQASLAKATSVPVVRIPLACEVRTKALRSRRRFGIRDSAYAFMFAFDFLSFIERKNPFGVIDAFRGLIASRPYADVVLVIKVNNSKLRPDMKKQFDAAIEPVRERVVVLDETLSDAEMKGLISLVDCFVSLHRSEGWGFGMCEAMCLGKPVIATAYSGNVDYCTPSTSKLIPFDLISLKKGDYPHWEDQVWADPDIEAATRAMLDLADNPDEGRALGLRGRAYFALNFSYLAVGLEMAAHLNAPRPAEHPAEAATHADLAVEHV